MTRSTVQPAHAARRSRHGVALVEFAFCLTFILIPILSGIWEVGRAVQVQQMVATAAREGARLASQGRTISGTGTPTDIRAAIAPASNTTSQPNVKAAVMQSLAGSGLSALRWADVAVTFTYLDGNTANTDPYQGTKNQLFKVDVVVQYDTKVRWLYTGASAFFGITQLRSSTQWRMLMDDPFTVNTTLPPW